ncbi:restriction endonuclease subunit S [Lentibacillus sp. N15]|uniref:restriction endonuclease subunit S n=1 Tax=Lentibacillus songyuanensis TaxID=3136161 RepID=UPI0031BA8C0A
MNKNEKRVPEVRFKGYVEDWEQRKLGELCEKLQSGKNIKSQDIWEEGKYPVFGGNGFRGYTNTYNHNGFYALIGRQGALCGNMNISNGKAYFTEHAVVVKGNKNNETRFLFYLLGKMNLGQYSGQSAQPGLAVSKLIELTAFIPTFAEQAQISGLFKQLDDTIALHQRKLDLLKLLKKGFMQVMFPQKGEDVPRLRFANFDSKWKQRKLGEVSTFINGRAYKQNELLSSGKYKVLRVGNFYTNDSWYYSDLELDEKYYAQKGELLYTWSTTFGPHIWDGDKVIYHYHIWKVELSEELDKQFAVQLLEYDKTKITSDKNGTTMVHITKKGMEEKKVILPNIAEQRKIGKFLKQLDNTIVLHTTKIYKLQTLKKYFLQKMFI